ncbi:TrmH family RNA methyltransferase [Candidatus Shapirobacteria bacterium]|nr:TrmH family RNA methyltransferase [Candidatus Shapirobacteria bacterium]
MDSPKLKLNSHQLRRSRVVESAKLQKNIKRNPIVLVLDNVLDTYNIGSFFRLADALGAEKIYLCGPVVTPPNLKIHRASIGTWKWIEWQHFQTTEDCLQKLKNDGCFIVACEQTKNSVNYLEAKYQFPLAIVAGSESNGVGESCQKLCDLAVEIPMYGINKSLNVLVASSIISFDAISKLK